MKLSDMVSINTNAEQPPPHKAMLYCPTCNHENRINGDWILHVYTDHLDYECPECGTTIESRREGPKLASENERTPPSQGVH